MTLEDFAMESLLAIEVQNEFERELNIYIDINKIKNITIKALKDYVTGNVEAFKHYLEALNKSPAK